ncbi:MAG: hypothetical protein COV10_01320 [Candidatus Vogelbacteria bacterium CG10_big_fil_rev_8_21_14_0_10_51_16]|uniref:MurNAc-LAA domain-containing protein n=1 Tax=Candidatus Vogelbacteria bacterium CG10_big_fil_rev_8_21_14_0_10_51_16 TaxID=1975045 RepID=A0A2H0RFJ3_9BACT|nr:MAG: hypothetical protein COV10_01320 [Candidatus Vogelbacteria bacterium CG10_big_fil_rev_8_21_14_0_10_51_16]
MAFGVITLLLLILILAGGGMDGLRQFAGLFFAETTTPEALRDAYGKRPISILVVPGHDNISSGTAFGTLSESDLNLEMAYGLARVFESNPDFTVAVTRREQDGGYQEWFAEYQEREGEAITRFIEEKRKIFREAVEQGFVERHVAVERTDAPSRVAFDLYTVNKYAIDNGIDIVLHLHWNDYAGRRPRQVGKYSGFAIYVPDKEMPNARASRALAQNIAARLSHFFAPSDMPLEKGVIVEDQELIAVGSNASQERASLLIEYGYIYESQFLDRAVRAVILKELAHQTEWGLVDFFTTETSEVTPGIASILPYRWEESLSLPARDSEGVLALQAALALEGLYPPDGRSKNDCPISGNFGPCTRAALANFQEKYRAEILEPIGLKRGTGTFGKMTAETLNRRFGE